MGRDKMKNDFARRLREAKEREFNSGLRQGIDFGLMITEIAMNNLWHFGNKRFGELEAEHNRILVEEVQGKEPELLIAQLKRRLEQIGG
jgi:hypothetical protein